MKVDVAIVGGGLVGGSLAAALSGSGLSAAILERAAPPAPGPDWDARIYAISPSSVAFLRSIGAWQDVDAKRVTPVHRMRVFGDDGASELDFSAYETGVAELAVTVESGRLASAIWRALQRAGNVEVLCPAFPAALHASEHGVRVELASGDAVDARLCVGADGTHSWVRDAAGFRHSSRSYGERGVIANFACEVPHRNTAYQWFRRDGVLAWLPVEERVISIVWSTPESNARSLLGLSPAELCETVARAGGGALGALTLLAGPLSFPLARLRTDRMARGRVALLGDAAHVVHPLAGQGVNLGLGDAAALARLLRGLPLSRDPGDEFTLRRFERERAEDILAIRSVTHGLHRLFGTRHPAAARIRNLGLNLTNSIPALKTMLARRAMGPLDTMKDLS